MKSTFQRLAVFLQLVYEADESHYRSSLYICMELNTNRGTMCSCSRVSFELEVHAPVAS